MKKLALLPLAALAFTAACSDTNQITAPNGANLELVSGHGTTVTRATVDVRASFSFTTGGGTVSATDYVGVGINEEGKEIGTCRNGRWTNPAGKQTGAMIHAHCVRGAAAASSPSQTITLEKIAGREHKSGSGKLEKLILEENDLLHIKYNDASKKNEGLGTLVAYGSKDGVRYGKFVMELDTYDTVKNPGYNYLDGRCYVGLETTSAARLADSGNWLNCLAQTDSDGNIVTGTDQTYNGQVTAKFYHDVAADITTATPDRILTGYLFWTPRAQ